MANSSRDQIAFVRTEDAPTLPPPSTQVGIIGWLWRNVLSSMSNFSTTGAAAQSIVMIFVTAVVLYLGLSAVFNLLDFAFFDAVWATPDGVTGEACRPAGPEGGLQPSDWSGACYPFISAKWKLIIYGSYDTSQIWRVDLVYFLGAVGVGWLIAHAIPRRRIVGMVLIAIGVAIGLTVMTLFDEGILDRVGVQILITIGAMWAVMPDNAPRRVIGLLMLAVYPFVAFLFLTGGDLEVPLADFVVLVAVSLALLLFATLSDRGILGEFGALFAGLARVFGWIGVAASVVVFLSSDLLVDMIEAGSGHVVTEREAEALEWWRDFAPEGRQVPASTDLTAFAEASGTPLTEEEIDRLRGMGWEPSLFGAASGPGARQVWPLPPVITSDWGGLLVTLVVSFAGIVFSYPLGVLLALGRRSRLPAVRLLSTGFIEFWRGVPLIYVLFMTSVMLPFFLPEGTDFNKLVRALFGVMFFNAAYQAEVVRGGLQALPKGQYEGAMALGLSYWRMMRLIILPQALTLVIPGTVNTMISLFKDTSLVLIISLYDLLNIVHFTALSDTEWASPVQASTAYLVVSLMFFVFCFSMSRYSMAVERQLRRGRNR